jgi:uncharacterized protein (DUF302 family)
MFDYTVETNKSINQAVESLQESLKEEKFSVLWTFDIKEKLQEKGLEFDQNYKVLEVCNPHEAQRILNENKMVGYFLPCKMVVYDDEGKTKIGMPKPSALVSMIKDGKIKELAQDIEERLKRCMDMSI